MKLRPLTPSDCNAIISCLNNESLIRYLTSRIPYPYTGEDAMWWIETGQKTGIHRAIEVAGEFAGMIGVQPGEFEYRRTGEIGYWLDEHFWGRGIASQALTEMTSRIFATTEIVRLFAPVFSPNTASMRVLEKAGYGLESIQKKAACKNDQFYDVHIYTILRDDEYGRHRFNPR